MGFWTKSRLLFNSFRDNAKASIRQVARQTGLSKSSVHRLGQAMARRNQHPESWFWETEDGHRWFIRLLVAVLYVFGLKRGGGTETLSEFFAWLRLEQPVGCSPSTLDQRGQDVPVATQTRLRFDVILPLWGRRGPR